ncbi:MAG: hypothetical protein WCF95_07215 [bacterium]
MGNMLKTMALGVILMTTHLSAAQKALSNVRLNTKTTNELTASASKAIKPDTFVATSFAPSPKPSFWQKLAKTSFRVRAFDEKSVTVMGDYFSDKKIGQAIDLKLEVPKAFAFKYSVPRADKNGVLKKHFSDARSKNIVSIDAGFGVRLDEGQGAADKDPKIIADIKAETDALLKIGKYNYLEDKARFKLTAVDVFRSRYVPIVKPNPKITNPSVNQNPQIFRATNLLGLRGTSDLNEYNEVSLTVGKLFEHGENAAPAAMLEWKAAFTPNKKAFGIINLTHVPKNKDRNQFLVGVGYKM